MTPGDRAPARWATSTTNVAKRNSTVTKTADGTIVPWLAVSGELAYTPSNPPSRRYHHQYGWHMPSAFRDRRLHQYFGFSSSLAEDADPDAKVLLGFWESAAKGRHREMWVEHGRRLEDGFVAPIASYDHEGPWPNESGYLLIQQGSYQLVPREEQPRLRDGHLLVYRGIGEAQRFELLSLDRSLPTCPLLRRYWRALEHSFSDSEVAFQVAHTFVKRSETAFLADELSWYNVVESFGLSTKDDQHLRLINFHSQSFALVRWVAERKFGPNYVVFSTPATNVRLISLFAGEHEVNVIDSRRLTLVEARGCQVERQEFAAP